MTTDALMAAVQDMETSLSRVAPMLSRAAQLDLTLRLLALRRAAGMPAGLAGPAGRLPALRVVDGDEPPSAA
jgi:hypothetical protein